MARLLLLCRARALLGFPRYFSFTSCCFPQCLFLICCSVVLLLAPFGIYLLLFYSVATQLDHCDSTQQSLCSYAIYFYHLLRRPRSVSHLLCTQSFYSFILFVRLRFNCFIFTLSLVRCIVCILIADCLHDETLHP